MEGSGVAEDFLAPALPHLAARYPDIRIELDATLRVLDLPRREAALALRAVRPESGDLIAVKIAEDRDSLLASPAYAAELGTLRDLGDARWIGWERLGRSPGTDSTSPCGRANWRYRLSMMMALRGSKRLARVNLSWASALAEFTHAEGRHSRRARVRARSSNGRPDCASSSSAA